MAVRLGLVIGNSAYRDNTLARLSTPDVDVGDLADVLLDPEIGAFDDVKVLVNASSATVRRSISDFYNRRDRDDLLLLYFSGHGVLDEHGRLFLAVKDTERQLLRATAIPASFITDEMNNSRSQRQVLVLDCCHSGAFGRGTKGAPGASVGTATAFEGTGFGRVVLTATDATQYAWEGDQATGEAVNSVFTHHLIRGLQSGEADANHDGRITIDEIYDYIYARVVQQTPKQTPGKWSYKEQGEIILARVPERGATEEFSARRGQHAETNPEDQLAFTYTQALSAYWLEEWEKARQLFAAVVTTRPDYQDAAAKLEEAERQVRLQRLYQTAQHAMAVETWSEAVEALEAITAEAPGYKAAAVELQTARKRMHLALLYSEARQLFNAGEWHSVLRIFERIQMEDAAFSDPENLLGRAKEEANLLDRMRQGEEDYRQALLALEQGRYTDARDLLREVKQLRPDYLETDRLLARIEDLLTQASAPPSMEPLLAAAALEIGVPAAHEVKRPIDFVVVQRKIQAFTRSLGNMGEGTIQRLPDRTLWQMLLLALIWTVAQLLPTLIKIESTFIWSVVDFSGNRFYAYTVLILVQLILRGIPASLVLWWALRRFSSGLRWWSAFILYAGWTTGLILSTVIFFGKNMTLLKWMGGYTLIGVGLGLAGWLLLRRQPQDERPWTGIRLVFGAGVAFAVGAVVLLRLTSWLEGLLKAPAGTYIAWFIGVGAAGLILAWALYETRWKELSTTGWQRVLIGAVGFGVSYVVLTEIFYQFFPRRTVSALENPWYIGYLFLLGFIGLTASSFSRKDWRGILANGLAGGIGLIVGHFLWLVVKTAGFNQVSLTLWGLCVGLALGIVTRRLPLVISMALLGISAQFVPVAFSGQDWIYRGDLLSGVIYWSMYGGIIGFLIAFFLKPKVRHAAAGNGSS
jgi:uncharacterized caspase-like protein